MDTDAFVELVAGAGEQVTRTIGEKIAFAIVAYNHEKGEHHVWVPKHVKRVKVVALLRKGLDAVTNPEDVRETKG